MKEEKITKDEYKTPLKIKIYRNKKRIIITSFLLIGIVTISIIYHYIFILSRQIQKKDIKYITIEQRDKKIKITNKKDINMIYHAIYERRKKTNKFIDSGYFDESDTIMINFNDTKINYYFYKENNTYYEENFVEGFYIIKEDDYRVIEKYIK
jgi:hypothetical protein